MAAPVNHWKLGLFVVSSIVLAIVTAIVLMAQSLRSETVRYKTFYDESVQGLDIGSSVKFRGVPIGNVYDISVAPDRRHVEVTFDLFVDEIKRLGLVSGKGKKITIRVPPDLRTQLATSGITGVKFLQIDFFDPKDNPLPELSFPTGDNYIPAAVSVLKNVFDSLSRAVNRFPELTDEALVIMKKIGVVIDDIEKEKMPQKASAAILKADRLFGTAGTAITDLEAKKLSSTAQETLANLNQGLTKLNALLDRASAEDGIYNSAERATNAVGDAAKSATGLGIEIQETLRSIRDAADSMHKLTDALETDSDMLLKGRAKP